MLFWDIHMHINHRLSLPKTLFFVLSVAEKLFGHLLTLTYLA